MDLLKKYKVESFKDVFGQEKAVNFLKSVVNNYKNYSNSFIITGDYGIGKTSLVYAFSNEMKKTYGYNKVFFIEFDSSKLDKNNIKELCRLVKDNFLFKKERIHIILFEEIQSILRKDTQDSLLKILEVYADNIIYFFTTTEYKKIIDTIKSRSLTIYANLLNDEEVKRFLEKIIEGEKIEINDYDKEVIIKFCGGHLRDCLQVLNLYLNNKESFYNYVCDYVKIVKMYLDKEIKKEEVCKYPCDFLIKGLYYNIEDYLKKNIKNNLERSIKIVEMYLKMKYYIVDINDLICLMDIIGNYMNGNI